MKLSADYIMVPDGDEKKSFLERHGYTREQFLDWVKTGISPVKSEKVDVKKATEDLDDFLS